MQRRTFIQSVVGGSASLAVAARAAPKTAPKATAVNDERAYLTGLLHKIAAPVLEAMSRGELQKRFVIEVSPTWDGRDRRVAYLECFGRLMSGLAPWLALPEDSTPEGVVRKRLTDQALKAFAHAVDPASPDYLLWGSEGQALVDSAYFSNALMRAPKALWGPLDATTKARIIKEIKGLRRVNAPYTNWLMFAAMNEAFLMSVGEDFDPIRLNVAVRKMNEWYVGDGWISDGEAFHFDYYNAYVIHPMLVEVLEAMAAHKAPFWSGEPKALYEAALKRMQRFSEHLERFISPTGTYPPIGRSLTYRTAAFQPLALLAWRKQLPKSLPEGQVRAALGAVHRAIFTNPTNFTKEGYLTIGFAGAQASLGDWYSNNGSMYITSESFLALGLPADDSYWRAPATDWTQKKAFASQPFPKDYAVGY